LRVGFVIVESVFLEMKFFENQKLRAALLSSLFLSCVVVAGSYRATAQTRRTEPGSKSAAKLPFEPAEDLVYVAEFSRAVLKKVDVAEFHFTASRQTAVEKVSAQLSPDKRTIPYVLKFTGDVSSKGFFTKLFNLRFREQVESLVDPSAFSVRSTKRIDEQGKRARISQTTYQDGKVIWTETDPNDPNRPARNVETKFGGQIQDVLSAIYYLRTQPLDVGKTFEVTVTDSGEVYRIPVKVIEKRRRKTVLGRVDTVRVDPQVFGPDRLIAEGEQFSIWLTDDYRRVPVSGRIKLKYGTFDITLRKITQNNSATEPLAATVED